MDFREHMRDRARELRQRMTVPERLLWGELRKRPSGLVFRRQQPIGAYVIDFCCAARRLAIEVDGMSHAGRREEDGERQAWIESQGWRVLRVTDDDVVQRLSAVVEYIVREAMKE